MCLQQQWRFKYKVPEPTIAQPSSPADIIDEVLKDIQTEEMPAESIQEDQVVEPLREVIQIAELTSQLRSQPSHMKAFQLMSSQPIYLMKNLTHQISLVLKDC